VESSLEQEIHKRQIGDAKIQEIKDLIIEGRCPEFTKDEQGTVWFKDRICVPDIESLRETVLKEAMTRIILFILVVPRCIRNRSRSTGGMD
jgi:hypothetical protein